MERPPLLGLESWCLRSEGSRERDLFLWLDLSQSQRSSLLEWGLALELELGLWRWWDSCLEEEPCLFLESSLVCLPAPRALTFLSLFVSSLGSCLSSLSPGSCGTLQEAGRGASCGILG